MTPPSLPRAGIGFAVLLSIAFATETGGGESVPAIGVSPIATTLPDVLVAVGDASVTAESFRGRVLAAALASPSLFGLGEDFLRHAVLSLEKERLGIPDPPYAEVRARVEAQCREGGAELAARLAELSVTEADLRRAAEASMLLEAILRVRRAAAPVPSSAPVSENDAESLWAALWKEAAPEYRGLDRPVAAVVRGRHFTRDDVLAYCIAQGRDAVLSDLLDAEVDLALLRGEARRRGWSEAGLDEEALRAILFEAETTDEALRAHLAAHQDLFLAIRVSHIFLAFDPRPGRAYIPGPRDEAAEEKTLERARDLARRLRENAIDFAETARNASDCPSASKGGDLGYLVRTRVLAEAAPPAAYLLDARGEEAALRLPPDAAILDAALSVHDGEIAEPVRCATGYSIVKRVETRRPRHPDLLLDLLRRLRIAELEAELLTRLRREVRIEGFWHPSRRDRWGSETPIPCAR